MRKSKFSESQIVETLKEADSGIPVAEDLRNHGNWDATFYKWRSRYGGLEALLVDRSLGRDFTCALIHKLLEKQTPLSASRVSHLNLPVEYIVKGRLISNLPQYISCPK